MTDVAGTGEDVAMSLLLVLTLTVGLSSAAGVFLSRANRGRLIPWERRPRVFSFAWVTCFFLSGSIGLTWTGDHFRQWGAWGMVASFVAWMVPWVVVQVRHNRQVVAHEAA